MLGQLFEASIYLAIASFVTWLNWNRPTRLSGVALVIYSAVSTITVLLADAGLMQPELKVLREITLATFMSVISFVMIHEGEPRWPHQTVMMCCTGIVCFCGAFSLTGDIGHGLKSIFPYVVNVGFLINCIAVAVPGAVDHVRRWISVIDDLRRSDGPTPDFDVLIRQIDGK